MVVTAEAVVVIDSLANKPLKYVSMHTGSCLCGAVVKSFRTGYPLQLVQKEHCIDTPTDHSTEIGRVARLRLGYCYASCWRADGCCLFRRFPRHGYCGLCLHSDRSHWVDGIRVCIAHWLSRILEAVPASVCTLGSIFSFHHNEARLRDRHHLLLPYPLHPISVYHPTVHRDLSLSA